MLQPNATFIGQIIVFLLLLWFVYAFVVPMIAKPVNERYQRIAEGLAAGDAGRKQLADANQQVDELLRGARERVRLLEEQAERRSSETVESARQAARTESARILAAARTEVQSETLRARDALRRELGALVVASATRLLEREIDERVHARLLEHLADDIERG